MSPDLGLCIEAGYDCVAKSGDNIEKSRVVTYASNCGHRPFGLPAPWLDGRVGRGATAAVHLEQQVVDARDLQREVTGLLEGRLGCDVAELW